MRDHIKQYRIEKVPYFRQISDVVAVLEAAYSTRMQIWPKCSPGCIKTHFIEHMAWKLQGLSITVACNENMAASDLGAVFFPTIRIGATR